MAKAVKLEDIAKCVGVSNVTVSKALADKSGVSEELRIKIKQIAEDLGYQPVSTSKAKEKKGTGNIGVIIPQRFIDVGASFYWEIYQNIVTKLQEKGYYAIIELLQDEEEDQLIEPKVLQDQKVDGIIAIGQLCPKYSNYIWTTSSVPVMFFDFYDNHMEYDTIITDGYYGMYLLTNHLIKHGHKEIYFVGTPVSTSSITDRFFGYQKALLENGIIMQPDWVINDREIDNPNNVYANLPDKLPTAFACNCDYTADALITKLSERGISVPEDISVVGFDNYLYPNTCNMKITTYEIGIDRMAQLCVKTLLRKVNHRDYVKGVQILSGTMIVNDTVAEAKR